MSNHSIIEHRANYHFIKMEEDYIAICSNGEKPPHCKALIMAVLEHWMNTKRDKGEKEWIYLSMPQWIKYTYMIYERNVITDSLSELMAEGFVEREPVIMFSQKTFVYRLNIKNIQKAIRALPEKSDQEITPNLDAYIAYKKRAKERAQARREEKQEGVVEKSRTSKKASKRVREKSTRVGDKSLTVREKSPKVREKSPQLIYTKIPSNSTEIENALSSIDETRTLSSSSNSPSSLQAFFENKPDEYLCSMCQRLYKSQEVEGKENTPCGHGHMALFDVRDNSQAPSFEQRDTSEPLTAENGTTEPALPEIEAEAQGEHVPPAVPAGEQSSEQAVSHSQSKDMASSGKTTKRTTKRSSKKDDVDLDAIVPVPPPDAPASDMPWSARKAILWADHFRGFAYPESSQPKSKYCRARDAVVLIVQRGITEEQYVYMFRFMKGLLPNGVKSDYWSEHEVDAWTVNDHWEDQVKEIKRKSGSLRQATQAVAAFAEAGVKPGMRMENGKLVIDSNKTVSGLNYFNIPSKPTAQRGA